MCKKDSKSLKKLRNTLCEYISRYAIYLRVSVLTCVRVWIRLKNQRNSVFTKSTIGCWEIPIETCKHRKQSINGQLITELFVRLFIYFIF